MIRWTSAVLVMFTVNIVQAGFFDSFLLLGYIRIDLPLYLLVAASVACAGRQATAFGFVLGLIVDLFQYGPFGFNALIYCVAGFTLADARTRFTQDGSSLRSMQALIATLAITTMTWLLGLVFGQMPIGLQQGPWAVVFTLAGTALVGAAAIHPVGRLNRYVLDGEYSDRGSLLGSM